MEKTRTTIRVVIPSKDIVTKLLNSDVDVEAELKVNLLEAIRSHMSKGSFGDLVARGVNEELSKQFDKKWGQYSGPTKDLIISKANEVVSKVVDEKAILSLHAMSVERINAAVDAAAKKIEDHLTDAILTDKIDELVEKRMKEKLGIK